MKRMLVAAALCALAIPALAQAPARPDHVFASAADIQALLAKAKADRKGDAPQTNETILSLAPYVANLEYRPTKATAAIHPIDTELMVVLEGSGTWKVGGTMVPTKDANPPTANFLDIEGGTSIKFAKGDMQIVPENTPHQVIPDPGVTVVLMTFHAPRPLSSASQFGGRGAAAPAAAGR